MNGSVFVVGSLHLDVIVDAPHLPRPDETIIGSAVAYRFGGKGGNQAVAAARMGASVAMAGRVGMDHFGAQLVAELDAAGVDRDQVRGGPGASGMSVAIVEGEGDYGAVIVSGVNRDIRGEEVAVPPGTAVILLQNEIPQAVNLAVAEAAPETALLILNAAPAQPISAELMGKVGLLVVNRVEAAQMAATSDPASDPAAIVRVLLAAGPGAVIVTLGADGYVGGVRDGSVFAAPGHPVAAISTHGAGDAFVGALAARIACGDSLEMAVAFAQGAAALHVATPVAERAAIRPEDVRRFLSRS